MGIDKVLGKIQAQINELAPTLELFVEESIQPSVNDCENLQQQLFKLQENLAIYKYTKQEKELSPSFNIHARVSEKNAIDEKKEKQEIVKEVIEEKKEIVPEEKTEVSESKIYPLLSIAINDKFRITNELFKQNGGEYNIAIEQLNSLNSWAEAEMYLNSLQSIYNWEEKSETKKHLFAIVKKRFA